jgi:hypothetical protein
MKNQMILKLYVPFRDNIFGQTGLGAKRRNVSVSNVAEPVLDVLEAVLQPNQSGQKR